ncbi:MAG: cytochrome c3 family protein [Myxococcota bacterium]
MTLESPRNAQTWAARSLLLVGLPAVAVLLLASTAFADDEAAGAPVAAVEKAKPSDPAAVKAGTEPCMECHSSDGDTITFADGTERSVYVDEKVWGGSVHGGRIACTDCHREITDHPHPELKAKTARDYTLERAVTCQRCHYAYYTRVLDSSHYDLLKKGNKDAPTCVDCHGSHATKSPSDPKTPRSAMNASCAKCHTKLYEKYRNSVHGKALAENNPDVPGCIDCHGAHSIVNPKQGDFHVRSYQVCARCHGDEKVMSKYGLSSDVLTTYLDDFHGASNRLYAQGAGIPGKPIATCTDCHGIHDIAKGVEGSSPEVTRKRVADTCRKCHKKVPDAFADAWMSHYPPTLEAAPLVWGIKWAYRLLIPFIMLGLVIHILLHLWRIRTHR